MTAYTPFNQNNPSALIQKTITQAAHGFGRGLLVIDDALAGPPDWITAQANSVGNSFATMMVSNVIDVNTFQVTQTGFVDGITDQSVLPFTAGANYYLSPTSAGNLTLIRPASVGQIILPAFKAFSANSGFFFGGSGELVESSSILSWSTVNTNVANTGVNKGYFTSSGGTITLRLPPNGSVAVGDTILVSNLAGNFSILTNPGQTINDGNVVASTSITSTAIGDSIELVCYAASPNALFQVLSVMGNLTPV